MVTDTSSPVDVLIVEDHELLAQSLTYALRAEGLAVATSADLAPETLMARVTAARPQLVLLDYDLGEHGTSLPLIAQCRASGSHVVMLTGVSDRSVLASCVEAGAQGVISKSQPLDDLVAAIRRVVTTGALLTADQRQQWLSELREHRSAEQRRREPFDRLTVRERQVLAALVDGHSADHIAQTAVVSLATVRSQIKSILAKLGVNSQLSAVALARQAGWSPEGPGVR